MMFLAWVPTDAIVLSHFTKPIVVYNTFNASDISLKKDIKDIEYGLNEVMELKPRWYRMKEDNSEEIGFVAQELEEVFPSMVEESADKDADGNDLGTTTKTIKTTVLIPILVKAIQEQQAMIEELKQEVAALKAK